MVDSLNKVMLMGNLGDDPKISELSSGSKRVASFSLATSHSWIGANGEKQTHADWHRVVVYGEGLVGIIEKLGIKKGSRVFLEGKLVSRKWSDKEGKSRLTVEVVLQGYNCSLIVIPSPNTGNAGNISNNSGGYQKRGDNSAQGTVNSGKSKNFSEDDFDDFLMDSEFGIGEEETLPY